MSSTYRILCLSHDPAIATGEYDSREAAAAAIAEGVEDHSRCDLLIGRYSYPLVEVGCPPVLEPRRPGQHYCYPHSGTEWVDAAWLRLLAAVYQSDDSGMRALAGDNILRHWPWERLRRLHVELGFTLRRDQQA